MSFINTQLPRRISAGFRGGPEWKTTINALANGREQRNKDWLIARYRYSANFGAFNDADRLSLISIFQAAGGRFSAFRFFDPTDYLATQQIVSPSVGTSDALQLVRTWTFGSATATSLIQAPIAATFSMRLNGGAFTAFTLDAETGLVTPSAPWGAGTYDWSGQHDRWVRFDSDWGAFVANAQQVWTTDMELVEVRR